MSWCYIIAKLVDMNSPINEGDIEIQLVDGDADEASSAEKQEGDRLEHFYTALNWVKQELVSLFVVNGKLIVFNGTQPLFLHSVHST